ncbi:MAG: hypothetical protein ABSB76_13930 [Streptosporangiaceae bacterium]|jgi:hypothetical protein
MGKGRSPAAWTTVLGMLALASFAAMIPLCLLSHQVANGVIAAVIGAPCAAIGVVVTRRQRANPLGWLFLVIGVCLFLSTDGGGYAWLAYGHGHRLPFGPVAVSLAQIWGPSLALLGVLVLLFPDGRLTSRFWRWTLWVYGVLFAAELVATAVAIAGALAARPVRVDRTGGLTAVDHPTGWYSAVQGPLVGAIVLLSLAFIARQALSWRRAAGERRQQLKWLASGAAVTIACLVLGGTWGSSNGHITVLVVIGNIAWLGVAALPVSIGVAILKYRLYEIDRIISRTLAYAIVTGLLVGVYAGLVLLATEVLQFHGPVAVATATLVAAALFSPLRRRVQHVVDRRFNRARYDAERTVAAFATRLQDTVDADAVRGDLTAVVSAALEPAHVSIWLGQ